MTQHFQYTIQYSVDRQALWSALRGIGIPNFLLDRIKDLHSGTTARVRVNGSLSEVLTTTSRVRQGCVLAPALFCRAMDWILERIASQNGIKLPEHDFTDLDYPDDVVLLDESASKLVTSLEHFEQEASHLGLHVSWQKNKLQSMGGGSNIRNITVMGQEVENVTQFTYLGSLQNSDGRCTAHIARRIGLAASAMRSFQKLWRQQRTQLSTKLRFYSSCVVPILLYGSETWTLQLQDAKRTQSFHMRCKRQILHVRWSDLITNAAINLCTGLPTITDIIACLRTSLFGHVARLASHTPAYGALACAVARHSERQAPTWSPLANLDPTDWGWLHLLPPP